MNNDLQSAQESTALEVVDNITESLIKARAVLDLVQGSGRDIKEGFILDHQVIMNSLWCIDGFLSEAEVGLSRM